MPNNRSIWLLVVGTVLFFGAALVTLKAAEQGKTRPPPSAPEESATITDDPVTAPDASQSADNNVSFPVDI
jgi:hypothetical protein